MEEYFTIQEITWPLAQYPDSDNRRGHFVEIWWAVQSGCVALTADVAVSQERLEAHLSLPHALERPSPFRTLPETPTVLGPQTFSRLLADPRSKQFLEALLYHVTVFQLVLKDVRRFSNSRRHRAGSS